MPVVINEFEVVPDAAPPRDKKSDAREGGDKPASREKPDFENVLRRWRERMERVRAH